MKFDTILQNQIKKYSTFDISAKKLEDIFKNVKNIDDDIDIIFELDKLADEYILEEIKKNNLEMLIKVIEKYTYIKTITCKNDKYKLDSKTLDNVYEKAINILKYRYDNNITMSRNIISNIKFIIDNNYINNDLEFLKDGDYDISFLNDYIKKNKISKKDVSKELECDINILNEFLNGKKKATKNFLESICIVFNVDDYEELKKLVINKGEENMEIQEKKYNISFIKNNLSKLNYSKVDLAEMLHVSLNKFNDLLEGKEEINESKLQLLLKKFKVNNYDELKYKIENYNKIRNINVFKVQKEEEKKYNFKFMKEYTYLYDVKKEVLAKMFHCGINKVEDVLNGRILFNKSLVDEICYENGYKNYESFKNDIENRIKIKKNNISKRKENKIENKNVFNLNNMDKNKLFELMDLKNMHYREALISILLFSGIINKTPKEISEFLSVSEDYILMVFKNDLSTIKENLKSEQKNAILIYEDKLK